MKKTTILSVLCTLSLSLMLAGCKEALNFITSLEDLNNEKTEAEAVDQENKEVDDRCDSLSDIQTDEIIVNPDIGFYRTINEQLEGEGLVTEAYKSVLKKDLNPQIFATTKYGEIVDAKTKDNYQYSNLTHLIIDLSYYSATGKKLKKAYKTYKKEYSDASDSAAKEEVRAKIKKAFDDDTDSYSDKRTLSFENLNTIFEEFRKNGKTTIVRFHYDPYNAGVQYTNSEGKHKYYDYEPSDLTVIFDHIEQICGFLKDYTDVITAIECGMIGPWGEMHGTTFGDGKMSKSKFLEYAAKLNCSVNEDSLSSVLKDINGKSLSEVEKAHSLLVMRKFLEQMKLKGIECPLLVRYPKTIYGYMSVFENVELKNWDDVPAAFDTEAHKDAYSYKLGMYNDGYLGSYSDYGTFKIKAKGDGDKFSRSRRNDEVNFLEPFLRHTAYGGELIHNDDAEDRPQYERATSSACEEMKKVHLSYLNISHSPKALRVLDSDYTYNGQSVFHYILSHMGYRYVITNLNYTPVYVDGKNVNVNLKVRNDGFVELPFHREKGYILYLLKKGSSDVALKKTIDGESFKGDYSKQNVAEIDRKISFSVSTSLSAGEYDVYLKVCDISSDSGKDGKYPIRFANKGIWNDTLKANKIGTVKID